MLPASDRGDAVPECRVGRPEGGRQISPSMCLCFRGTSHCVAHGWNTAHDCTFKVQQNGYGYRRKVPDIRKGQRHDDPHTRRRQLLTVTTATLSSDTHTASTSHETLSGKPALQI